MLKRVSIQNFKSLKDVTLDLQKVNLLIGPNNSGKTNFLKALEYFEFGVLRDDVAAERQSRDLRYKRSADFLSISLTFQNQDKEQTFLRKLVFSDPSANVDVRSVQITTIDGIELMRNDQGYPDAAFLRQELDSLRIYRPDPNKFTQPGRLGISPEIVVADASNLVGFLDLMLGKYRKTIFSRIEADLYTCLAEFDEIKIEYVTLADALKKQFGDESFKRIGLSNSTQGITYWADELSEGTLYFVALLCIINQPNPPKLLLLEEPEKGIHPRRIREVMDFIFRLAEEKDVQIILTSHNEHVLDDFATRPEAVFVFDKDEEGATYVRNLQTDIIEPTNRRNQELGLDEIDLTTNLSENWLYGLLGGVPSIP